MPEHDLFPVARRPVVAGPFARGTAVAVAAASLLSLPAAPSRATTPVGEAVGPPACRLSSPAHRVALVELFTREGCSACRVVQAWLDHAVEAAPGRMVGLVWSREPSALPPARHLWLTARRGRLDDAMPAVYLAGREWDGWRDAGKEARSFATINRWPAGASIAIEVRPRPSGTGSTLVVRAEDAVRSPSGRLQLQVALVGPGPGPGRGDAEVRVAWPPVPIGPEGGGRFERAVVFDAPDADAVVAFVQDTDTAEVLQALRAPLACGARPARP